MEIKAFKLFVPVAAILLAAAALLFAAPLTGSAGAQEEDTDEDGTQENSNPASGSAQEDNGTKAAGAQKADKPLIDQTGAGEGSLINQGDGEGGGDTTNLGLLECRQILNQIGGDQYAGAEGAGDGNVASANNQEFTAQQIQQCQVIVGQNNQGNQNVGGPTTSEETTSEETTDDESARMVTTQPKDVVESVSRTTLLPNTGGVGASGLAGAGLVLLLSVALLGFALLRRNA